MSIYLAYAMLVYIIGSVMYLLCAKFMGTPLIDSYSEEQIIVRTESAKKRSNIFMAGILMACVLLYIVRPFKNCECI
jgi:hypothetical protein